MTHDHRTDPDDPTVHDHPADETRPVERQTYVERQERYDPPPAQAAPPAGSQVNVNAERGGYVATAPGPLSYARRIVSLIFGILAVLLALRIVFLLLVANQGNAIVDFVYSITEPFVAPFRGIFNFDMVGVGDATLDVAALVALIGWFLIYLLIMAILSLGDRRTA
jgi:uncharacterized protein YggT (Ycf19 family)